MATDEFSILFIFLKVNEMFFIFKKFFSSGEILPFKVYNDKPIN